MNKELLRKELLHKRNALSLKEIENKSNEIFLKIISTEEYKNATTIMFYISKGNEVSTIKIIEHAFKNKKEVCVPKTDIIKHILHPIKINALEGELKKGHFGIHEPLYEEKKVIPLHNINLIVLPGIAFDTNGHRLGWGKGYYDKFLEKHGKIHKAGLAFEFQILPELPKDKHDIPVNMIVTEERVIKLN
jgi:5-formyltetrahydrofolate cyclo-ligase